MKGKMKGNRFKAILLIAVFIITTIAIAIPYASAATTYYVDDITTGNDDGTSPEDAFRTIQQGVTAATAVGDLILVLPGTYTTTQITGLAEGVILRGNTTNPETVTITANFGTAGGIIFIKNDDVTVEGFTIVNEHASGTGVVLDHNDQTGINVVNNIIDVEQTGIELASYVDGSKVTIGANISYNTIPGAKCGINIYGGSKDNTISYNIITGGGAWGSISFGGGLTAYRTEGNNITGNTITDGAGDGITMSDDGKTDSDFYDNNLIAGNIISGHAGNGIVNTADLVITGFNITGNYITDNGASGIKILSWEDNLAASSIYLNDIAGNDGYGIESTVTSRDVNATLNWWGDIAGPGELTVGSDVTELVGAGSSIIIPNANDVVLYPKWLSMSIDDAYETLDSNPAMDDLYYKYLDTVTVTIYNGELNTRPTPVAAVTPC